MKREKDLLQERYEEDKNTPRDVVDNGWNGSSVGHGVKNKKPSKDNMLLIVALVFLGVLVLMAVVHAHFVAVLVVGITLGTLLILINKKE